MLELRDFLIGLQNDVYSGKQDYFIFETPVGDHFFITDACGQFNHVARGTLTKAGKGDGCGLLCSIGKGVTHYGGDGTVYDVIDNLCDLVKDMKYLGRIRDSRVLVENAAGTNRVVPTCKWAYVLEKWNSEDKLFAVSITDREGLTGEAKFMAANEAEARKEARQYIKAWKLSPAKINYCCLVTE